MSEKTRSGLVPLKLRIPTFEPLLDAAFCCFRTLSLSPKPKTLLYVSALLRDGQASKHVCFLLSSVLYMPVKAFGRDDKVGFRGLGFFGFWGLGFRV